MLQYSNDNFDVRIFICNFKQGCLKMKRPWFKQAGKKNSLALDIRFDYVYDGKNHSFKIY